MTSSSATCSGRTQPSGSGRVMPLSWSSTRAGSSAEGSEAVGEEDAGSLPGAGAVAVSVTGGVRVRGLPSSSSPSTNTPVTIAATSTAAAAVTATALPRPPVPVPGPGSGPGPGPGTGVPPTAGPYPTGPGARRCSVQAVPSHQRSWCGADGSRYQPGGGVMLIPAL